MRVGTYIPPALGESLAIHPDQGGCQMRGDTIQCYIGCGLDEKTPKLGKHHKQNWILPGYLCIGALLCI